MATWTGNSLAAAASWNQRETGGEGWAYDEGGLLYDDTSIAILYNGSGVLPSWTGNSQASAPSWTNNTEN